MIWPFSAANKHLKAARAAMDAGKYQDALGALAHGFRTDSGCTALYKAAVQCLRKLDAAEETALFEAALAGFRDADAFFNLGYHFVDVQQHSMAAPFLERALSLAPGRVDIACELALACCADFRPQRGLEALSGVDLSAGFPAMFQYNWCSLLCGRAEGIRDFLSSVRESMRESPPPEAQAEAVRYMLDKLDACLTRLEAIDSPRPIVQDWHFIQYGAAILDYFDDSEESLNVAGGRWVAVWLQPPHLRRILQRLRRFLVELDRVPQRVVSLPDRDSEIVGHAVALTLVRPFAVATAEDFASPDTLVVAFDAREFQDSKLMDIAARQTLFAVNVHWLAPAQVVPDIAGCLSQACFPPWHDQLRLDNGTKEPERIPADQRPPAEIAADILSAEPDEDAAFTPIFDFYRRHAGLLAVSSGAAAKRLSFQVDSPVPGAYFR